MLKTINTVLLIALLAGVGWTFKVKADAEAAKQEIARLEQRIHAQKEAIEILRADWSLLISPERLERLAARYRDELALEPADPERIGDITDIPHPWELPASEPEAAREGHADSGAKDGAVTGSIQRDKR